MKAHALGWIWIDQGSPATTCAKGHLSSSTGRSGGATSSPTAATFPVRLAEQGVPG